MAARFAKRQPYQTLLPAGERDPTLMARILNGAIGGQLNVVGDVQIKAGTTETWIHDPRIGPQSVLLFHAIVEPTGPASLNYIFWLKERGTRKALYGHEAPGVDVWIEYVVIG